MMRQQLEYEPFDYSDGLLATVSGGRWTQCSGYAAMQVVNGAAYNQVEAAADAAAVLTSWAGSPTDQYAQQILGVWEGGVTLRSDAEATFIFVDFVPGDGVYVFEVILGTLNLLDTPLAEATTLVHGDVLYAEIQGNIITVKQNEIILGTRMATGAIGAGKPGVYLVGGAGCDDWTAGDFQAPSPLLAVGLV